MRKIMRVMQVMQVMRVKPFMVASVFLIFSLLSLLSLLSFPFSAFGAELVRLNPDNWHLVPGGKEVDAIYGDYLMRNDKIVAVIADVALGRNANLSCRNIQGALIDLALLETNSDQLTAFLPNSDHLTMPAATAAEMVTANGAGVRLRVIRPPTADNPIETVTEYALQDGKQFLQVTTRHRNIGIQAVNKRISDKMRCDQSFSQTPEGSFDLVYFYDKWFLAAYGVVRVAGKIYTNGKFGGMFGSNSGTWLDYPDLIKDFDSDTSAKFTVIEPNQEISLTRYIIAGKHPSEVQLTAYQILQQKKERLTVTVIDGEDQPVSGADIVVKQAGKDLSAAYTDEQGKASFGLPNGQYILVISQIGRAIKEITVDVNQDVEAQLKIKVGSRSQVAFDIIDGKGKSSLCKVQFIGVEGTPNPELGPDQRANGCRNLYFSHNGKFRVPLPAGKYYLIISHGPEYDAVFRYLNLNEGQSATVSARLTRVVDSKGWISADFHNHSSESGDNTTLPESRITCLVAEGLDFAASTEHNRIQTYRHRLKALGLEKIMATSDGIEFTGSPGALNHQNAFPLQLKAHTQDGGAPLTDADPLVQIKRLFYHDNNSEKLVQQNHPDIGWLFYDKDGDGQADMGFGTFEFTHVIEIWATNILAMQPTIGTGETGNPIHNNRIFNWLQLLNQGFRLPGVANTDAHYCFHQSGVIRNYIASSTDDPTQINEMEVMRRAKKGQIVMTNGPFMEVSLNKALPGDDLKLDGKDEKGFLQVRVQCANWLDVDRVQVLVNGRPDPKLNFTRDSQPQLFSDGVIKFDHNIEIELKNDAHLIVVAIGEKATIGPVMGPRTDPPIAISNPIFVDVDGNGFQPNKDTLDAPLPTKK